MTSAVIMLLLVVYMILGLYIYHAIFNIWYLDFGKAILKEIIVAFIFGAFMTGLTMKFSIPVMVIIIILGIILGIKAQNPVRRMATIIIFVVIGIIIGFSGQNLKKTQKENAIKKAEEEKLMDERLQIYFEENPNSELENFVVEDLTYKMVKDNLVTYMNVYWDSPIYTVSFLQIADNTLKDNIVYIELQGSEEWQQTFYGKDDKSSYITINRYDSLDAVVNDSTYDFSGHYSLATEADEESYYELYEKSEFSGAGENDYEDLDESEGDETITDEELSEENDNIELYKVEVAASDGYVNFRTGAGTDYEIICEIYNGEQLSIYEEAGDWLCTEYADTKGWIAASQVEKISSSVSDEANVESGPMVYGSYEYINNNDICMASVDGVSEDGIDGLLYLDYYYEDGTKIDEIVYLTLQSDGSYAGIGENYGSEIKIKFLQYALSVEVISSSYEECHDMSGVYNLMEEYDYSDVG